jgi:hypothetical protein
MGRVPAWHWFQRCTFLYLTLKGAQEENIRVRGLEGDEDEEFVLISMNDER